MCNLVCNYDNLCKEVQRIQYIDLAFLSHPQLLKQCCVTPPLGTSDHKCIHLSVTHHCGTLKPNKNKSQRTIWRYQQADFDRANGLLDEVDWEELLEGDVDQMWTAWEENFVCYAPVYTNCQTIG